MAVIYSYPKATPTASDLLIGTLTSDASGENPTKSFSISDIIGLVPAAGTGGTVTSVGLTNTDTFLTIGNSPITTSGNISIDLTNNGGTPSATTFYRGDGKWAVPPNTVSYQYTLTAVNNAPNIDINLNDIVYGGSPTFVKLINGTGINMISSNNEITISNTGVNSIVGSTFIGVDSSTATAPIISLSATGTSITTKFLRGDNTWQTIAAGGTMSSWTLAGDTGTPEQVDDGQTVTIAGGTGVSTVVSASDTVTVNLDSAVPTSIVAGTNIQVSGTGAVTVAAANVLSNSTQSSSQSTITDVISLTAAEYAAIGAGNYNANTLYIVI
tara:strand:- start:2110 stop:3090 length:981 start_codon:yes stop_codon:yes gene_type:complete